MAYSGHNQIRRSCVINSSNLWLKNRMLTLYNQYYLWWLFNFKFFKFDLVDVLVCCVHPGTVRTDVFRHMPLPVKILVSTVFRVLTKVWTLLHQNVLDIKASYQAWLFCKIFVDVPLGHSLSFSLVTYYDNARLHSVNFVATSMHHVAFSNLCTFSLSQPHRQLFSIQ